MKTGISILHARDKNVYKLTYSYEANFKFILPPIYKVFIETFILGEDCMNLQKFTFDDNAETFACESYNFYHEGENIGFSYFLDIEKAVSVYNSGSLGDIIYTKMLFPVGSSDGNGIYVGLSGEQQDQIFWEKGDASGITLIADNIFDFTCKIVVLPINENFLINRVRYADFSKKWGDDVWKVNRFLNS